MKFLYKILCSITLPSYATPETEHIWIENGTNYDFLDPNSTIDEAYWYFSKEELNQSRSYQIKFVNQDGKMCYLVNDINKAKENTTLDNAFQKMNILNKLNESIDGRTIKFDLGDVVGTEEEWVPTFSINKFTTNETGIKVYFP